MKILLSAGHGGTDGGSTGADGGKEKDRTINLANKVASYLRNAGHNVTVNTEKTSSGAWRFKNRSGYDYALSIHFNAFDKSATGTECWYKGTQKKAGELSSAVANVLGIKNRGAKATTALYMMNIGFDNLIEVCFHDNSSDLNKYNSKIDAVAKTIADVVNGNSIGSSSSASSSTSSNTIGITGDITYQSYDNAKKQWLPEVVNYSDYAGNFGNAMGGLRAKCKYGEIKMQVHTVNGSWLDVVSSKNYKKNDKNSGASYAGIYGKNIDGVRIWSSQGYVTYQAHLKGGGWLEEVDSRNSDSGGANSYAGVYGKVIDAVRMK